jgi:hypothetical protein
MKDFPFKVILEFEPVNHGKSARFYVNPFCIELATRFFSTSVIHGFLSPQISLDFV